MDIHAEGIQVAREIRKTIVSLMKVAGGLPSTLTLEDIANLGFELRELNATLTEQRGRAQALAGLVSGYSCDQKQIVSKWLDQAFNEEKAA